MTIRKLYNLWMEEKRSGLRPASLSTYTVLAERYILPAVGEQEAVTPEDVQRMMDAMAAAGKSVKTRRQTLNVLSNILSYGGLPAVSARLAGTHDLGKGEKGRAKPNQGTQAGTDPAQGSLAGIAPEQGPQDVPAIHILLDEAVRRLIGTLQQNPTPRNVGLYLALTTGIRASELCALRWQDLDDALHIRGSVSYLWDTDQHAWRPKEEGEQALVPRDIPLTREQKTFLQQTRGAAASYLLTGELEPMPPHTLRASTRRFLNQNGLSDYSLADFRHTFAARCLKNGCNFTTLAALLGVQSVQALQKKYGRFAQTNPQEAMEGQMAGL